ncbi:MAG: AtpZ/AtpI family protein [Bacteroidales bacterium]|nr:AtpZ/AtpI family protein [Bacteroidales bacterium]MBP5400562.1 AtpZ/AtpI family protein [Bacteroidales bacterium]
MAGKKQWSAGASYSGMAFQMGIIIAGGTYGGIKLDDWLNLSPLFTIVCALASIALAMYVMINKLTRINQKKKSYEENE